MITFALTSCGRFDLLKRTLDSFFKYNTYPISRYKIIEDSGTLPDFAQDYPQIEWIVNDNNIGQMRSIDRLYSDIDTKYIFHCEEDWEFLKSGFIEESIKYLEQDPTIIQCWLRGADDTNGHPLTTGEEYDTLGYGYQGIWHGFSLNPGVKRTNDYDIVKPFYLIGREEDIGLVYMDLGYHAISLKDKYIEHIGWGRHVQDAKG